MANAIEHYNMWPLQVEVEESEILIGTLEKRLMLQLESEGSLEEKEFHQMLNQLEHQQMLLNKKLERQRMQARVCMHVGGNTAGQGLPQVAHRIIEPA